MSTLDAKKRVGIDFGTSTTLVADRPPAGAPSCISVATDGGSWIPTLVGVNDRGTFLVGDDALRLPAARIISSVKAAVTERRHWIEVRDAEGNLQAVRADEVISMLLDQIRLRLISFEPDFFSGAQTNMACPASWDDEQRERFLAAALSAGLDVSLDRLFDEPVAAGTAFLQHSEVAANAPLPNGWIVVVDAGGGTLDLALLEHVDGQLTTLVTDGNDFAGDAVDRLVLDDIEAQAPAPPRWIDPHGSDTRAALLLRAARELKEILTVEDTAERPLFGTSTVLRYERARFEQLLTPMVQDLGDIVERLVRKASDAGDAAPWSEVSAPVVAVQLAGGTTRIPLVKSSLEERFTGAKVGPDPLLQEHEAAVVAGLTYL